MIQLLQQRCNDLEQHSGGTEQILLLPDAGRGIFHRAALLQGVLEILLDVPDAGGIHHPDGIFKVMVQAGGSPD